MWQTGAVELHLKKKTNLVWNQVSETLYWALGEFLGDEELEKLQLDGQPFSWKGREKAVHSMEEPIISHSESEHLGESLLPYPVNEICPLTIFASAITGLQLGNSKSSSVKVGSIYTLP